jgi:hypothetical protein
VQPNDVHLDTALTDDDTNDKHHSYLKILESPEKVLLTNNKCANVTELASSKRYNNETAIELDRSGTLMVTRETSDINQAAEVRDEVSDSNQQVVVASHQMSDANREEEDEVRSDVAGVNQRIVATLTDDKESMEPHQIEI